MKINKYIFTILFPIIILFPVGCTDFDELNSDPNASTVVSPGMLCTTLILDILNVQGSGKSFISNNALPKYVGYATDGQIESQYNRLGHGSFAAITNLPLIEDMLKRAEGSVTENSYKGVAKLSKALIFYRLSMRMGDVPYFQANQGQSGNYTPTYDSQESVLLQVLELLEEADAHFANGVPFFGDPTPFNGNPQKWRKATNSVALSILMSLSKKENLTSLNIKQRFANIVSSGNILDVTTNYFGLDYSTTNKHPLNNSYLFTSRTIISSLLIDNLKLLNDRRMFYFADPSVAQINSGLTNNDPNAYVGVDVSIDYATMTNHYNAGTYSILNKRYRQEQATEPNRLFTYAEQQLIIAEAIIKGWISGNAQTYYEQGVKAALTNTMAVTASYANGMAINQSYIDNYFTGEAAFKTDAEDQLKQIRMQRYLLNFMQNAESSYFEYRRTGYPVFPINPNTSLNTNNPNAIPMRWMYPENEYTFNSVNLTSALQNQFNGSDDINKIIWALQ